MLKERHEIETNYNHLHIKLSQMQTDEHDRKDKVRKQQKEKNFSDSLWLSHFQSDASIASPVEINKRQ